MRKNSYETGDREKIFIYLLTSAEGYCKIGISQSPKRRVAYDFRSLPFKMHLTTSLLIGTREDAGRIERRIQDLLKSKHIRNEWFREICPSWFRQTVFSIQQEDIPITISSDGKTLIALGFPKDTVREQARKVGKDYFFVGSACSNGHKSSRYVSSGDCIVCIRIKNRIRNKKH